MSPLSSKQKAQALDTVIGSCMAYLMPLGLMTLSDVSKCDAIKLNICKRIYKLPRSTPSAMVHQDRERAGLGLTSMHVMYAKLTCTYPAKALNDKAPLGFVTCPMLMLQNEIIGESLKQGPSARYLRQTSHYHLARQLTVLQTSGLELTVPAGHQELRGNFLSSTLSKTRYDPCYLGLEQVIPPEIYHKLLEITDNFAELCLPNKQKVILLSTSEVALKFGRAITNQHKKALNQLTKLLNQYHLANDIHGARFQNVGPLSIQGRTVVRPEIVSELRSRNTNHLDSREINDIECRALAMLREHSLLNTIRKSRKSNKSKPCRREEHDARTGTSPESSSNLADDQKSSDDGPDSPDPNTAWKDVDAEQTASPVRASPGRAVTVNRRSTRLSALQTRR